MGLTALKSLKKEARRLGTDIIFLNEAHIAKLKNKAESPFLAENIGICRSGSKIVVYISVDALDASVRISDDALGGIIHELGHICVQGSLNGNVNSEDEWFGWEYTLARKTGLLKEWICSSKDYGLVGILAKDRIWTSTEFGGLTKKEQAMVLNERLEFAEEKRFVVRGSPRRVAKKFVFDPDLREPPHWP
jgi:hypothetical protein